MIFQRFFNISYIDAAVFIIAVFMGHYTKCIRLFVEKLLKKPFVSTELLKNPLKMFNIKVGFQQKSVESCRKINILRVYFSIMSFQPL